MNKVIAVVNQKGGVGKTTTAVNLSASVARCLSQTYASAPRVLLVDLDPQGNATMGSGVNKSNDSGISEALLRQLPVTQTLHTGSGGYDVLPSNARLTEAELSLLSDPQRHQRLKELLSSLGDTYAYTFIDCPPTLNLLTINALVAADSVMIPMQCEYFALEGIASLMQTMDEIKRSANPELFIEGIVRTMFDGRNRLADEVSRQLYDYFGTLVYDTLIPRNVRLAEAPSHGVPVLHYDPHCMGAEQYLALAQEFLKKQIGVASSSTVAPEHQMA